MKRIIAVLSIFAALLPVTAKAQIPVPDTGKWFTTSSVMYVNYGPQKGSAWYDAGIGRRLWSIGSSHISGVIRALKIEDQDQTSMNVALIVVDPLSFWKKADLFLEVGTGNKIAVEGEDREWGLITGAALNVHVGSISSIYVGGKVFQNAPGRLNAGAVGGGAVLYLDDFFARAF